jgi:biotin carboxylase
MILGAALMQGPALRIAKEMGLETVAVDGNAAAPCAGMADSFEHIDLKDREGIAALALRLKAERGGAGLSGVFTAGTDFSATVAYAAEKAGLPGIPYEAALDASDKERMRRRFAEAGLPSPRFIIAHKDRAGQLLLPFPFPVVVKPVDNMGARGCRRADTEEDLRAAVDDALSFSRSGRAIIEEYMDGPEFSADAIVYDGEITICGFADRHIFFPPYFIEMGHTIPSDLAPEKAAALIETFKKGVRSLGITLGAAKGDIKLTSKGPMLGEIAARLSGGYMSGWTYPYSSGAEPTKAGILAALGQKPDGLGPERGWTSAERAFISIPGIISAIKTDNSAENSKYVQNVFFRVKESERVDFPENNVSKCGNVISAAPERAVAVQAAEDMARSILIRLEKRNAETDAFLNTSSEFPPDAFSVTPAIRAALREMPRGRADTLKPEERGALSVIPFSALLESPCADYVGRGVAETLDAVRRLTGLPLPLADNKNGLALGKNFWTALIRGGYQGAAYFVDSLE